MENRKGKIRFRIFLIAFIFVLIIILAIFIGATIIRKNQNSQTQKVIGIDVSAYQGTIDWNEIEKQGIYFAYIKATESVDYKDKQFDSNWNNINQTTIKKGAYLFYDFSKDGNLMADFFIKTVPVERNTLPPAIDIELTNESSNNLPDKNTVIKNINKVIKKLKENYNIDPIIYTNVHTYDVYFKGTKFDNENIKYWICDINNSEPDLNKDEWKFWQFTWRGMLNGMDSEEKFVDLDVYNGNLNDFYNEYDSNFITKLIN